VNDAWRAVLAQNYALINGDSMRYSAGNEYDQIYIVEGTRRALAFLDWGHPAANWCACCRNCSISPARASSTTRPASNSPPSRARGGPRATPPPSRMAAALEKEARRLLDERTGATRI
jgi:hypothetical protein